MKIADDLDLDTIQLEYDADQTQAEERGLVATVLDTYYEDVNTIEMVIKTYLNNDLPIPNHILYRESYPYIDLHSLVYELNHERTEELCDILDLDVGLFRSSVLDRIKQQVGRDFNRTEAFHL